MPNTGEQSAAAAAQPNMSTLNGDSSTGTTDPKKYNAKLIELAKKYMQDIGTDERGGIPVQYGDDWKNVWYKMKYTGWTWVKAGQKYALFDFVYVVPGGKKPSQGGKEGIDYFTNEDDVKSYAVEHYGWSGNVRGIEQVGAETPARDTRSTRSSSAKTVALITPSLSSAGKGDPKASQIDSVSDTILPDDEWVTVMSKLEHSGWTSKRGTGLVGFYYILPGRKVKGGKEGVDYLTSEEAIQEYCVSNYGWDKEGFEKRWQERWDPHTGSTSAASTTVAAASSASTAATKKTSSTAKMKQTTASAPKQKRNASSSSAAATNYVSSSSTESSEHPGCTTATVGVVECEACLKLFSSSSIQSHRRRMHGLNINKFGCPHCTTTFNCRDKRHAHIVSRHPGKASRVSTKILRQHKIFTYVCPCCDGAFNLVDLENHLWNAHSKDIDDVRHDIIWLCPFCPTKATESFHDQRSLKCHVEETHNGCKLLGGTLFIPEHGRRHNPKDRRSMPSTAEGTRTGPANKTAKSAGISSNKKAKKSIAPASAVAKRSIASASSQASTAAASNKRTKVDKPSSSLQLAINAETSPEVPANTSSAESKLKGELERMRKELDAITKEADDLRSKNTMLLSEVESKDKLLKAKDKAMQAIGRLLPDDGSVPAEEQFRLQTIRELLPDASG